MKYKRSFCGNSFNQGSRPNSVKCMASAAYEAMNTFATGCQSIPMKRFFLTSTGSCAENRTCCGLQRSNGFQSRQEPPTPGVNLSRYPRKPWQIAILKEARTFFQYM